MKTQGILVMRDPKIVEPEDFLHMVFWNKPNYALDALRILKLVGEGKITRRNWKEVVNQLGMNKSRYYYILRRLKALGLVYKDEDTYRLSERFSRNLEKLASYWEDLKGKLEKS